MGDATYTLQYVQEQIEIAVAEERVKWERVVSASEQVCRRRVSPPSMHVLRCFFSATDNGHLRRRERVQTRLWRSLPSSWY
jgi:hypothetical protein